MGKKSSNQDRRQTQRFSKTIAVEIQGQESPILSESPSWFEAKNIATGGLCIISPSSHKVGVELDMTITLANWDPDALKKKVYIAKTSMPCELKGKVVRCERLPKNGGYELGIEFVDLDEGAEDFLKNNLWVE